MLTSWREFEGEMGFLSRFKRNRNDSSVYKDYCKVRNQVQRDIKTAKANFFLGKIRQSDGDSNKLWGLLKSLGYSDGNVSSRIVLEQNGEYLIPRMLPVCLTNSTLVLLLNWSNFYPLKCWLLVVRLEIFIVAK